MPFNGFLGPSWEMYALTRILRQQNAVRIAPPQFIPIAFRRGNITVIAYLIK